MANLTILFNDLENLNFSLHWIYQRHLSGGDGSGVSHPTDNYLTMWFIEKGSAVIETVGHGITRVKEGEWFICKQGTKRTQQFSEGVKLISLWLKCDYMTSGQPTLSNLPKTLSDEQCPLLKSNCLEIIDLLASNGIMTNSPLNLEVLNLSSALQIKSKTVQIASELVGCLATQGAEFVLKSPIDPRVRKGMMFLEELDFTGAVPYNQLCRVCGMSKVQIDRLFMKEIKLSPRKFLQQCCLQRAHELLIRGSYTVSEIAYKLNFSNASHFCTWFKRITGNSPRKTIRNLY